MTLTLAELPLDRIQSDETVREPDRRLTQSLQTFGLFDPIHVRALADGAYQLVDGSRRLAAARALSWERIAALVEPAEAASHSKDLTAIILNTRRQNLRQLHVARHARRLITEENHSQAELARELHLGKSTLSTMLKVVECPDLIAAMTAEGLEFGAAKALVVLSPPARAALLAELREEQSRTGRFPPVRQVEVRVRVRQGWTPLAPLSPAALPDLVTSLELQGVSVQIETHRSRHTHLRVSLAVSEEDEPWVRDLLAAAAPEAPAPVTPNGA